MSRIEKLKAIVRRSFEAAQERDIKNSLTAIAMPDYVHHWGERHETVEDFRVREQDNWRRFPDCTYKIDDLIGEGDRVALRWTMSGTDTDQDNKPMLCQGISIVRFEGDKIAESWEFSY